MTTYYDDEGNPYESGRPSGPRQSERVAGIPDDLFYDPLTGATYDMTPGTTYTPDSGGGWGGGGGGTIDYTDSDARIQLANEYDLWMGDGWAASHPEVIEYAYERSWGADAIRMDCVDRGANSVYANSVWAYIRSQVGDVSASVVQSLMRSGAYKDSNFESYIAPQYSGSSILTNRQSDDYVELWNQYTAGKAITWTAEQKLQEIANTYGYTADGYAEWERWLRTTDSANAGNYGAAKRSAITEVFTSILQRQPTDEEISKTSDWMNLVSGPIGSLNSSALVERIRQTDEWKAKYEFKPDYMDETEWLATSDSFQAVGNWYFNDTPFGGDNFQYTDQEIAQLINEDWTTGSLISYYQAVEESKYDKAVYGPLLEDVFGQSFSDEEWFALANGGEGSGELRAELVQGQHLSSFKEAFVDLYGREPTPSEYSSMAEDWVSPDQMKRDFAAGQMAEAMYPEISNLLSSTLGESISLDDLKNLALGRAGSGALNAKIAEARRLDQYTEVYQDIYGRDPSPAELKASADEFSTPAQMRRDNSAGLQAEENLPETNELLEETMGVSTSADELKNVYLERAGTGSFRAMLVEARNRLEFREAYRQVHGRDENGEWIDPTPEDYERITNEFISPTELLREHQAKLSVAEMYPEISELMMRIYGRSITEDELIDMALGRDGAGELKAFINEAEKLDRYRWVHEQYYGVEPTPDDYAKYAGYSGVDELQWEIATNERIAEYSDTIKSDFKIGMDIDITDDDIRLMMGEQKGYGELRSQWAEAKKRRSKAENAEQAAHDAEKVNIAYRADETGGFRASLPGLATL